MPKIKIQNFEFEVPHTKSFNINWNFLAKTYLQYYYIQYYIQYYYYISYNLFAFTISSISISNKVFTNWVINQCNMFTRQPGRWYQMKWNPCDRSVRMRIRFVAKTRLDLLNEQALHVLMKRMVQANIKRQNYNFSVKNVVLMPAKTILSNIIPVVNQKRNRLYDIFAMKVLFSGLCFVFSVFLLISNLI